MVSISTEHEGYHALLVFHQHPLRIIHLHIKRPSKHWLLVTSLYLDGT